MQYSKHLTMRALLAGASLAALAAGAPALAQDVSNPTQDATQVDEVVVTGIRAAQQAAVNVKRDADSVVDAISAEDIGKLPDITIADSLQRIPGVQIRREAGEGGRINVRGLPQVTTLLNGEAYLGAGSVTTTQPNFTDIPSQLFRGADVIKSPTANLLAAGITGTIDLKTRRPFDMDDGWVAAGAVEGAYGDETGEWNPQLNGLLSWRGDRFGVLVSAAYSDVDLANSYSGIQRDYGGRLSNESIADASGGNGFRGGDPTRGTTIFAADGVTPIGVDVNGDGDANDAFFTPQAHTGWQRVTSRERLGLNASFQARLTDALELTGDAFFTDQTQYDRTAGFQFQAANWQGADYVPGVSRDTGAVVGGYNLNTVQQYDYTLQNFDSYSDLARRESQSLNLNLELKFDNGGPFTGRIRALYGEAENNLDNSYLQFSLTDGVQWFGGLGNYPASIGGDRAFNPLGYRYNTLPATVAYSDGDVAFALPAQLSAQLSNVDAYALKTMSSENNVRAESDMSVIRADGAYVFNDRLNVEFGARYNERSAEEYAFDRAAPLYAGQGASASSGCFVKWKAFDVRLNSGNAGECNAPDGGGGFYTAGLVRSASDPAFGGQVKLFDLPVGGVGQIYVLDPAAMDDPLAFQNSFYPGNEEFVLPGRSYDIDLTQWSGYSQVNFESSLAGVPLRGNIGVRVLDTEFTVRQNLSGPGQPYGLPALDVGDVSTKRSFTDVLPAFNIAADFTENFRVRFAYAKTMTLLDLAQWGGGLDLSYAIDTTQNPPLFRVTGGSSNGNPELDPWRASNFDLSFEYYLGRSSLINVGLFYIDVDSFIERSTITRNDLPDLDGVVRNPVPISANVQGEGGTLQGVEVGAKLDFEDLRPGFLTGFGVDANYTFSDSTSGRVDLAGEEEPFQDNSRHQANVAVYYEDHGFQARIAYNYRSKRVEQSDFAGISGLTLYQEPTEYLDASVSYDVSDTMTVYAQGSNLTGEYEQYYLTYPDQRAFNNIYETRYLIGVRARF